ncbi:MAG: ROK family protein [Planctomycetes bacterium]|nr:ROK family protein [Planctomycetota bacterium]
MSLAIGIDLGGTAIKGGIVSSKGEILHRTSIDTHASEGVDAVIDRMAGLARTLADHAAHRHEPPLGIGVGSPGMIRQRDGVILSSPNLDGWRDVPLVAKLGAKLNWPITLNNDANNAALGEFRCGAGIGRRNFIMLTLGTGVGGGIIANGKLYVGSRGNAGELGHTIVHPDGRRCGCGQSGCLEAYASAPATAQRAVDALESGQESVLRAKQNGHGQLTSADIVAAAQPGDSVAQHVWMESCKYLAIACVNFQHVFDPDCIAFAGGMSEAGQYLIDGVNLQVAKFFSTNFGTPPAIMLAKLGSDAGLVGAAMSAFEE